MMSLRIFLLLATTACGRIHFGSVTTTDASAIDGSQADANPNTIALDGGASWRGWTMMGSSQTTGLWVSGNTDRTYVFYAASFILDPAQTVTAPLLGSVPGDGTSLVGDAGELFDGNWQAGDHVFGIGIAYTGASRMSRMFVHFDVSGTGIVPASSFGATDGVVDCNTSDAVSYFSSEGITVGRFRESQYSVFTGFSDGCGTNFDPVYAMPLPSTPAGPSRSFVVLDSGDTQLASTGQFLHDFDAAQRQGGGTLEGACGPNTHVGLDEGDFIGTAENSLQIFPLGGC